MKERTHRSNPLTVRSAALRSNAFRGWNTNSIGLRSGEYSGRYRSSAPRASIASSATATLWTETLSATTMSPPESRGKTLFDTSEECFSVHSSLDQPPASTLRLGSTSTAEQPATPGPLRGGDEPA
jgi:hypothetical protein